jgi:uncharacterized coiled-coil protein SlyX
VVLYENNAFWAEKWTFYYKIDGKMRVLYEKLHVLYEKMRVLYEKMQVFI